MSADTHGRGPAAPGSRPTEILLVTDVSDAAPRVADALGAGKLWHRLHVVADGPAALAFLRRVGAYAAAPHPDLVLVDLRAGREAGWRALATLTVGDGPRHTAVVALAATGVERAILERQRPGTPWVVTQPLDVAQLVDVVREDPWLGLAVVALPDGDVPRAAGWTPVARAQAGE